MTEAHGTEAAVRRALAAVDLNLLPVLDALLETHSVTESGRRLGLSQPAVSRALARLRAALDDELLVRTGRVMVPTPRALALQQPLRDTLHQVHSLVRPVAPFDPAQHARRWRVVASRETGLNPTTTAMTAASSSVFTPSGRSKILTREMAASVLCPALTRAASRRPLISSTAVTTWV